MESNQVPLDEVPYQYTIVIKLLCMYFSYSEASSHKTRRREFVMTHIKAWLAEFLEKKLPTRGLFALRCLHKSLDRKNKAGGTGSAFVFCIILATRGAK